METKKLLQIKKEKKAKQPAFLRRNYMKNKRSRVGKSWRAPIGLHNKLRRRRRGIGQWVMPGYRMPVAVRGLTTEGLLPVIVDNTKHAATLDAAKHVIILKSSAGKKNRVEVVKEAIKKKIKILNLKDPVAYLKAIEEEMANRKKSKKVKIKEAPKVEKIAEKKAEPKVEEKTEEADKKEQNKILTKIE